MLGVVDQHLQHEAIDLRLGQRIRSLGLDRVLRRHHEEGIRNGIARVPDRDLALLHHLEQRGLHLRRRPVDLVGQQEVAEHGPELRLEGALAGPVDAGANEIRGHEVRRELDPRERAPQDSRSGLDREGLGESRHALDQKVALGQQTHEDTLEHVVLTRDHPPDLEERLLEAILGLRRRGHGQVGALLGHVLSLLRFTESYTRAGKLKFLLRAAGQNLPAGHTLRSCPDTWSSASST